MFCTLEPNKAIVLGKKNYLAMKIEHLSKSAKQKANVWESHGFLQDVIAATIVFSNLPKKVLLESQKRSFCCLLSLKRHLSKTRTFKILLYKRVKHM